MNKQREISADEYRAKVDLLDKPVLNLLRSSGVPFEKWDKNILSLIDREFGITRREVMFIEEPELSESTTTLPVEDVKEEDYPTYEQTGAGKPWDEMTELERAYYNLSKTLDALAITRNANKRLREQVAGAQQGSEIGIGLVKTAFETFQYRPFPHNEPTWEQFKENHNIKTPQP